jgi:hypothetical protein
MPRSGQLIPLYIHPHDEVYINDNTVYTDYTADNDSIVRYLCIFASAKGRDKLMNFNNFSDWLDEYGAPNYRLYGQATYMPYTMLFTGMASCQCLRVVAEDATYANLILVVGYKAEGGKLKVKFKLYSREGLRNADELETVANSMETTKPDEDGYKYLPLATFWCLGRGAYGNDFRIRLSHDKGADKENDYKNYGLDILSTEKDASLIENFNVTFYIDAVDPNTKVTLYAEEVLNDEDGNGSQKVNMEFFHDNYETLFQAFSDAYYGTKEEPTVEEVDRLPAITLPSTTDVYVLTKTDGTFAPGNYVYNAASGMFAPSNYTISTVATLPSTLDANTIYSISGGSDIAHPAGTTWILHEGNAEPGPKINTVLRLPSTTLYKAGVVYTLTADDGDKKSGTQWIYDDTSSDFIAYTAPEEEEKDPLDLTIETFDIFGYDRVTKKENEYIEVEGGTESITLFDLEGVALQNGSDGSLAEDQPKAVREAAMEAGFIRALDGDIDRMILNKRRTPVEQMYDANLPVSIKKAMAALAVKRGDMLVYLDCGLLQTTADLKNMANSLASIDTYLVSLNSGMMYTADPITGKNIPVSILLWMASRYPAHVYNNGWYTPFAGERYAIVSGYSSVKKIKPVYDEELDADTLEELYADYHINYLQALDEDTIVRGTQITCQSKTSDLSKENNVMLTLEVKRKIERLISKNRYNWTSNDDIRNFKNDCEQVFSSYAGTKCASLSIDVQQSAWERTRYILHVYLVMVFRKYQERGIVEIDLNPS